MTAIRAEGLVKTFRSGNDTVTALDGVDLDVNTGTVVSLLGPNGAGKTTAVRILTTLLRPDGGSAQVAGYNVLTQPQEVRSRIGLSGQFAAVDENLTGRENLRMFGQLYQLSKATARRRADELLEQFSLTDAADRVTKTYSGGMRRRLDLAGSLLAEPEILFLDEPTTGLDPRSRLELWDVIRQRVRGGATILLTTQYLEEADALADRIVVIDHGKIIAEGTADELKAQVGGERIEVVVHDAGVIDTARHILEQVDGNECLADRHTRRLTIPTQRGAQGLVQVVREFDEVGIHIDDIGLRRPTLDDVFLKLTGRRAEEDETDEAADEALIADGSRR